MEGVVPRSSPRPSPNIQQQFLLPLFFTLNSIPMTRFDENADHHRAIEGLGTNLAHLDLNRAKWSNPLLDEGRNPTDFPPTSIFVEGNNGEHHEHRLVDQCLTCDLQVPRISSATTSTLSSLQTRIST